MAGKGGRAAKGGRGKKGSDPPSKAPKKVKAAELCDSSSEEVEDTLSVLRSLIGATGTKGRAAHLAKGSRQKNEMVHVECDREELGIIRQVLKEKKRTETHKKEQAMAASVAHMVFEQLAASGVGLPRTDTLSGATETRSKKKKKEAEPEALIMRDQDTSDTEESPAKPNRYNRMKGHRDKALDRASKAETLLRQLVQPVRATRYSSDGEDTSSPGKASLRAAKRYLKQLDSTDSPASRKTREPSPSLKPKRPPPKRGGGKRSNRVSDDRWPRSRRP